MALYVKPFSQLPRDAVSDYLIRQCGLTAELVQWKYFESHSAPNRERGFACFDGNRVSGTLGLIPFRVSIGGTQFDTAWSCDWSSDASVGGLGGILLMKHMLASYPLVFSLGGSEHTRAIMPRFSQIAALDAGLELHKPLRLGGLIRAAARVSRIGVPDRIPLVDGVPVNISYGNSVEFVPSQDIVSEFRVQTNSNTVEYGAFIAGKLATPPGTSMSRT